MRKSLTPPEARLWSYLKTLRSQKCHFRRLAPFRGYFLDFACYKNRLVIEADGLGHDHEAQAKHDRVRDAALAREGFRTLRFTSKDVALKFEGVIGAISEALLGTPPPRPLSRPFPPHEGEGDRSP